MDVNTFPVEARWFAGKRRPIEAVEVVERFDVAGGEIAFADVEYAEGAGERYLLIESIDWASLLGGLADGPLEGRLGRVELRGDPSVAGLGGQRTPATDQSNTLVALGERVLVKAYRRLEPGPHPEVELLSALTGRGAPVPAALGSIHHVAHDGADTALALLEEFVPGAEAGWEAPIERVAAHLRGEGPAPLEEFEEAGRAAARLHAVLAEDGGWLIASSEIEALREGVGERWRRVVEEDPALATHDGDLLAGLAGLSRLEGSSAQTIHGDLHYAQFLRAPGCRPLIIDFEGDPTRPLAERRAIGSTLRDLASLVRSIDHIGSAAARRAGAEPDGWIEEAREAALRGYGPVDGELLHALELAEEVRELVYAQTTLPEWLYAPKRGLERLLEKGTP